MHIVALTHVYRRNVAHRVDHSNHSVCTDTLIVKNGITVKDGITSLHAACFDGTLRTVLITAMSVLLGWCLHHRRDTGNPHTSAYILLMILKS